MKLPFASFALIAAAAVGLGRSTAAQSPVLTSTGLFPVYDASGETHGEPVAGYLTSAMYEAFRDSARELVLLNPGGEYSLLDEAASLDYAKAAGVQSVIITRLAPTLRTGPKDGSPRLKIEVRVVEVATAKTLYTFQTTEQVYRKDLDRGFDTGPGLHTWFSIPGTSITLMHRYYDKSRKIEKQPLGKADRRIAEAIRTDMLAFNSGAVIYPSAALHPGPFPASCTAEFAVHYTRQRAASKAYGLIVNDREESAGIADTGVVQLTLRPGLTLFEVAVKDAPYRLPVQKTYAVNRFIDCSASERHLSLDIGGAGEALVVARP